MKPFITLFFLLILFTASSQQAERLTKNNMPLDDLKKHGNSLIIMGCVFSGIGALTVTGYEIGTINNQPPVEVTAAVLSAGGALAVAGLVCIGIGVHDLKLYSKRKEKEISFAPSHSGIGFAMTF